MEIDVDVLDRVICAKQEAVSWEQQAREAWFDGQHGAGMLKLMDGRVFGTTSDISAESVRRAVATCLLPK